MLNRLLHLKHWQIFFLLYAIPITAEFILLSFVIATTDPAWLLSFLPLLIIYLVGIQFSWYYALAANLQNRLPMHLKMNLSRFHLFFFFPLVYIILFCLAMIWLINRMNANHETGITVAWALIIPVHFFAIFCVLYCFYFIAKSLRSVELNRAVTSSDYIGEFFLLWFLPVGIWFIQPRINRIFGQENSHNGDDLFEGYQ